MRLLSFIIAASIGLALMQAAAKLAAVLAIIVGLAAFATRPHESIGCVVTFVLLGMIGQYPLPTLAVVGALVIAGHFAKKHTEP